MLEKIFKKNNHKNISENDKHVLVTALLVHASKIDENYSDTEKNIIKKALIKLFNLSESKTQEILSLAEIKEKESNQILEFTKEIKKQSIQFRLKIMETLFEIIFSDKIIDMYESNLIRRVSGLLYLSDKDVGEIKKKFKQITK